MQMPSLALRLLRRAESCQILWGDLEADGPRYINAARFLVAQGLCVGVKKPRGIAITREGRLWLWRKHTVDAAPNL